MSTPAWLALAATCSGVVALLVDGRRGAVLAVTVLGAAGGGLASLSGGLAAFAVVLGPCVLAAVVIELGARGSGVRSAALGPLLPAPPSEMFGSRALRVAGGIAALLAARWLAGHVAAGLVVTPVPVFSCAFLWEVGILRAALARTPQEIGLGILAAAVATSAFLLLRGGTEELAVAALAVGAPAGGLILAAIPRRLAR
ncbi:MAG TPA: hypothetical protein VNN74_03565 [Candidatus Micrarchaeia archaeon]|nr:hypothetical protein [Candidatus Micrarchaeia archaeon]